jgi:hypothetical protein
MTRAQPLPRWATCFGTLYFGIIVADSLAEMLLALCFMLSGGM